MKKILLASGALMAVLVGMPMFAAWEAHVVNVTATIENALSVPATSIQFGTVFPQEHLDKTLDITLSDSFSKEVGAKGVTYVIRQKPKCGVTTLDGTSLDETTTTTGHVFAGTASADLLNTNTIEQHDGYYIDCGPKKETDVGHKFGVLPMLCPYISKHPDATPTVLDSLTGNDGSLNSFHLAFGTTTANGDNPFTTAVETGPAGVIVWNDTPGFLDKTTNDTGDNWKIDLAAPCFAGHCAQDWASFVTGINPSAIPDQYIQPTDNEHKVFGCDLWIETTGVTRTQCSDGKDNDGDGKIDQADPVCSPNGIYDPSLDNEGNAS